MHGTIAWISPLLVLAAATVCCDRGSERAASHGRGGADASARPAEAAPREAAATCPGPDVDGGSARASMPFPRCHGCDSLERLISCIDDQYGKQTAHGPAEGMPSIPRYGLEYIDAGSSDMTDDVIYLVHRGSSGFGVVATVVQEGYDAYRENEKLRVMATEERRAGPVPVLWIVTGYSYDANIPGDDGWLRELHAYEMLTICVPGERFRCPVNEVPLRSGSVSNADPGVDTEISRSELERRLIKAMAPVATVTLGDDGVVAIIPVDPVQPHPWAGRFDLSRDQIPPLDTM